MFTFCWDKQRASMDLFKTVKNPLFWFGSLLNHIRGGINTGTINVPQRELWGGMHGRSSIQMSKWWIPTGRLREELWPRPLALVPFAEYMRARWSQQSPSNWTCVIAMAMERRLACICLLAFVIFRGEEKIVTVGRFLRKRRAKKDNRTFCFSQCHGCPKLRCSDLKRRHEVLTFLHN